MAATDAANDPPAPWLTAAQAAARLGCSPRRVRQRCVEDFRDHAQKVNGQWRVHPLADPRLQDESGWDDRDRRQLAMLRAQGVKPAFIRIAEARRNLVLRFREFKSDARTIVEAADCFVISVTAERIVGPRAAIKRLSRQTLFRWRRDYRLGGLAGLVPGYAETKQRASFGRCARQYLIDLLHAGNGVAVSVAYQCTLGKAMKEHPGDPEWRLPALRTVQKWVQEHVPSASRRYANKGPRAFVAEHVAKAARDYESIPSGDQWCGDQRTLDVMVRVRDARHGWRPSRQVIFTCWIDVRSRMVTGWILDDHADSNTILCSLKDGIRMVGKPRILRVDWGRDYRKAMRSSHGSYGKVPSFDGARVATVLDRLAIRVEPAAPYCPWAKPIESMFRQFKERMDKLFVSYWGGSPNERHEQRDRWVRAHLARLPTIDELRKVLARFIDFYNSRAHRGQGMFGLSPIEAMARFRDGPARMESETVLEFLFLDFVGPKLVRRDGIRCLHRWYGHGDPRLIALQGKKVYLGIDPCDVRTAYVCDLRQRPLFQVEADGHVVRSKRDAERNARGRSRLRRAYADIARRGRELLAETGPAQLIEYQRAALPDAPSPADVAPLRIVTARPGLEKAIGAATPAADEAASNAVRDAFEDELLIDELLDDEPFCESSRSDGDDRDDDEVTLDDITGE